MYLVYCLVMVKSYISGFEKLHEWFLKAYFFMRHVSISPREIAALLTAVNLYCAPVNAGCFADSNSQQNGKFKIVSIAKTPATCHDKKQKAFYPGCLIEFETISKEEKNQALPPKTKAFSSEKLCGHKVGDVIDGTLQRPCCDLGGLFPICDGERATISGSTDASLISCHIGSWFVLAFKEHSDGKVTWFQYGGTDLGFKKIWTKPEHIATSDDANFKLARERRDGRFCKKMSDKDERSGCLMVVSETIKPFLKTKKDIALCESLESDVGDYNRALASCLATAAETFRDPSICERYNLGKFREQGFRDCFREANVSVDQCDQLKGPFAKDWCFTDTGGCERVKDKWTAGFCWSIHINEKWKIFGSHEAARICRRYDNPIYCLDVLLASMARENKAKEALEVVVAGTESSDQKASFYSAIANSLPAGTEEFCKLAKEKAITVKGCK